MRTPQKIVNDLLVFAERELPINRLAPTNSNTSISQTNVFRGEVRDYGDTKLMTSFGRQNKELEPLDAAKREWERIARWDIEMRTLGKNAHIQNDWELIAEAQHFGVNTRLLDWTKNPLFALWIACDGHERYASGMSYENYFSDNQEVGFVHGLAIPYKPWVIAGKHSDVTLDGGRWAYVEDLDEQSRGSTNFNNPIFKSNDSKLSGVSAQLTHKHYYTPNGDVLFELYMFGPEACKDLNQEEAYVRHSILFFELASSTNPRVRSQSGLFSIHTPARFSFKEKESPYSTEEFRVEPWFAPG